MPAVLETFCSRLQEDASGAHDSAAYVMGKGWAGDAIYWQEVGRSKADEAGAILTLLVNTRFSFSPSVSALYGCYPVN